MKNIKRKLKFVLFPALVVLLAMMAVPVPVSAGIQLPHNFSGTVKIDEVDAPIDTVISARFQDVEYGSVTTTDVGLYSDLLVTDLTDGDIIHFYVDDVDTTQTFPFGSGYTTEDFNLTVGEEPPVDTTPPTVLSTTPEADAPSEAIDVVVNATFSEDIQAGDNFAGIAISEATGVSASIDGVTLTIAHDAFAYETSYTVTIPAGAVKDLAGNPLAEAKVWSFTVVTEEEAEFDPYTYDTDEDGEFSKAETLAAVDDYLAGNITKDEVLEVVKLYFS